MGRKAGAGDDVVGVRRHARDREVALDAATLIEELRIDEAPDWPGHVVGANPAKGLLHVAPDELKLGKGGLIEERHALARGLVFAGDGGEPVRAAKTVDVVRLLSRRRKPVRPLPAELFAEHRALLLQQRVQRRAAQGPAARVLLARPGDGVVLAVQLKGTAAHPTDVQVRRAEAPDVDGPQIERGLAADDPLREHQAGAATRGNAESVESGADKVPAHSRGRPEDEVAVGRETLRPVDELLDAGG